MEGERQEPVICRLGQEVQGAEEVQLLKPLQLLPPELLGVMSVVPEASNSLPILSACLCDNLAIMRSFLGVQGDECRDIAHTAV